MFGICGAVECAALAFGPLISGSIAHADNWRINFWTIVGLGSAVALGVSVSVGHLRQNADDKQLSVTQRMKRLDWYGLATELPMTICLILSFQWAGTVYAWSNWRIILLLTVTGVLAILFFVVEHIGGSNSMISLPILRQRNVAFSCVVGFCNFAALWIFANYVSSIENNLSHHCWQGANGSVDPRLFSSSAWSKYPSIGFDVSTDHAKYVHLRAGQWTFYIYNRLFQSSIAFRQRAECDWSSIDGHIRNPYACSTMDSLPDHLRYRRWYGIPASFHCPANRA